MIKALCLLIFVQGFSCEVTTGDIILDTIAKQLVRFGDPEDLFHEDVTKLKVLCDKYGSKELEKEKDKILPFFTGLGKKLAQNIIPHLSQEARQGCVLLKKGEDVKAARVAKAVNKKVKEAEKLKFGFITVMNDAIQPNTKITLGQIICYIKQYCDKLAALYSDDPETLEFIKIGHNEPIWDRIIEVMEKDNMKEETGCKLSEADSNPSELQSTIGPFLKAIEILEKKN